MGEPPLCEVDELGALREREMACAVDALGGCTLVFLDYTDPRIGPDDELYPYTENLSLLAGQVAAAIEQHQADAVITHGSNGEYGHPAHVLTHQAALMAVKSYNGSKAPP